MLRKCILVILLLICSIFVLPWGKITAKENQTDKDKLPEKEGIYNIPGNPKLKLKVFVHFPKQAKPQPKPTPTPNIVCPNDDIDSTAIVTGTGWKLPSSWTYTLNTSTVPSTVGSANWGSIAASASVAWTDELGGKVTLSKTGYNTTVNRAKYDRQNIIAWGRASSGALAITYTWYYPDTGEVAEVDTIMNQQYPWYWQTDNVCTEQNSYDAQDILTHELGHWFGLDDHYTDNYQNNTMYGYGAKGETKKDTLTTGDIGGLQLIYSNY